MRDIEIDIEALEADAATAEEVLREGMEAACREASEAAVQSIKQTTKFKDRTGNTRRSARARVTSSAPNEIVVAVELDGGHVNILNDGSAAHTIVASKKALSFAGDDGQVFAKSVEHPGTKPTHFLDDAGQAAERVFEREMGAALDRSLRVLEGK